MAAAAIRLLRDQEFARQVIENAHEECDKYSWENVREKWLEAYRQVVGIEGKA
jgi:glycosyltransferase involved in cell wall biosynthesis